MSEYGFPLTRIFPYREYEVRENLYSRTFYTTKDGTS